MVGACDICGGDDKKCEEENERVAALAAKPENAESLAYNADKDAS